MDPKELKYLNAFNSIPNVGPVTLRALKKHFGNFAEAWTASESALREIKLENQYLNAILLKRPSLNPDREMEKIVKAKIWMVTEEDEKVFPKILKEISSSPLLIYGRGDINVFKKIGEEKTSIGIVGTRKPTSYGLEAAERIASGLADAGLAITSGLATGIDTKAHQTALECQAQTIAVLGSGVDHFSIFPQENQGLAQRIAESGGAVISEYAPGTPAVKEHFPMRNRIIAGLSRGVVVIEAREKSGESKANFAKR